MKTKPWLATYRENGIAESVNADAYPSVVHMLDEAMQRYAERTADYAFGIAGDVDMGKNERLWEHWKRIEGNGVSNNQYTTMRMR